MAASKSGGSLKGLKASTKRVGPVDPKGAYTKVQEKTLAGSKGKASLTRDKQLGATKMAKNGGSFPDLNKDGKITKADVLKGRGVIAKKGAKMAKCKYGCN
jgi:hypothetical protein